MCDDKKANGSKKREIKITKKKNAKKILITLGMKVFFTRR